MARSVHVRLAAHGDNPPGFHHHIEATLTVGTDGALDVVFAIHGMNLDLRVPTPHAPAPADALWKTTCCELFLGAVGRNDYREFNFSPSGQWAAYDFADTRRRVPGPVDCPAPTSRFERDTDHMKLAVALPRAAQPGAETLRIAVSTILEAEGGRHGYWALVHPPGRPDFHHPSAFALHLDPAGFHPERHP
jgi:hypothetical protein